MLRRMKSPTRPDQAMGRAPGMVSQAPWAVAAVAIVYMMLHRPPPAEWPEEPSPSSASAPAPRKKPPAPAPGSRMEPWMDFHGVMVDGELARIGARLKKTKPLVDFWQRDASGAAGIRRRLHRFGKSL